MTDGIADIRFSQDNGVTRLAHLYQRDPLRVLFPAPAVGDPPVAVIVTTSGGLVAGDRLEIDVELAPGAAAHVTASAAEKVYRSTGRTTTIKQTLSIGPGAALEFLPPETILFDGARLRRETIIDLAPGSAFLGGDIVVFGRRARGERFASGFLREVWEVYRDRELVWGDALHLEDDVGRIIDDPACFDGAAAFATMILSPPGGDARSLLESARVIQSAAATTGLRAGATAIASLVIARWLAADAAALRRAYADLACYFRSAALGFPPRLPRVWHV
ncbi:MAG TPA: urease accessory protein UreD [Stellaceae bacterium]|nr:urease accessory protein UreD [Stellaceae bacterium]